MSRHISQIGPYIDMLFDYRASLGYSTMTHAASLERFDRYCAMNYAEETTLTMEMVHGWLQQESRIVYERAMAIRLLGKYMSAIGVDAYVLPEKYVSDHHDFAPYIFTDEELRRLFAAIDQTPPSSKEPYISEIAPVLFRLIYTCGLRPNEGRELLCENVHLDTGEILITHTKKNKERIVVMSEDMREMMRAYNERRTIFGHGNEYWFPSCTGTCLASAYQTRLFQNAWKRANPGVPLAELPRVRVYDLRHRFASAALIRWLEKGELLNAKLPYLRSYMGHKTLNETLVYIHILPENLTATSAVDWDGFYGILPEVQYGKDKEI